MNRSIFGYGVAARPINGVGNGKRNEERERILGVEEVERERRWLLLRATGTGAASETGRDGGVSWPEWCFPGVSMSIYLPGAYSDKSVIAAEASERVAPPPPPPPPPPPSPPLATGTARHLALSAERRQRF